MRTSSQSFRPDDSGNQIGLIGQAEVSASALGHPFKIRASKLTFEWLFNSKTETLGRLHYIHTTEDSNIANIPRIPKTSSPHHIIYTDGTQAEAESTLAC